VGADWCAVGSGRKRGTHKEGFGRSRGGFTSKIHARSDGQRRPLGFVRTGGETPDYKAVDDLMALPVAKPKLMLADKGYDSDDVHTSLLLKGILPVIPPKANRKEPIACDFRAYKEPQPRRANVQQPPSLFPNVGGVIAVGCRQVEPEGWLVTDAKGSTSDIPLDSAMIGGVAFIEARDPSQRRGGFKRLRHLRVGRINRDPACRQYTGLASPGRSFWLKASASPVPAQTSLDRKKAASI
jgi:hypothetical protein